MEVQLCWRLVLSVAWRSKPGWPGGRHPSPGIGHSGQSGFFDDRDIWVVAEIRRSRTSVNQGVRQVLAQRHYSVTGHVQSSLPIPPEGA
jgi:hypothetical protein